MITNSLTKHACDYSSSYAEIYDSPYGCNFVFVDEENECSYEEEITYYDA